jgi:hypothetical protein
MDTIKLVTWQSHHVPEICKHSKPMQLYFCHCYQRNYSRIPLLHSSNLHSPVIYNTLSGPFNFPKFIMYYKPLPAIYTIFTQSLQKCKRGGSTAHASQKCARIKSFHFCTQNCNLLWQQWLPHWLFDNTGSLPSHYS